MGQIPVKTKSVKAPSLEELVKTHGNLIDFYYRRANHKYEYFITLYICLDKNIIAVGHKDKNRFTSTSTNLRYNTCYRGYHLNGEEVHSCTIICLRIHSDNKIEYENYDKKLKVHLYILN